MIAPDALADLDRLLEGARLGNRPPLSQRQRETIAELAAYYKAALPTVPETGDGPCITMPEVGTIEVETVGVVKRGNVIAPPLVVAFGALVLPDISLAMPIINWDTAESPEGAP